MKNRFHCLFPTVSLTLDTSSGHKKIIMKSYKRSNRYSAVGRMPIIFTDYPILRQPVSFFFFLNFRFSTWGSSSRVIPPKWVEPVRLTPTPWLDGESATQTRTLLPPRRRWSLRSSRRLYLCQIGKFFFSCVFISNMELIDKSFGRVFHPF